MKIKEYLLQTEDNKLPKGLIYTVGQYDQWKFEVLQDLGDKVEVVALNKNLAKAPFMMKKDDLLRFKVEKSMFKESTDYTSSYPTPDNQSQSFVILALCIGQAKFHEPALNTLSRLPEKDEESMIEAGIKVLENKMEASAYVDKLFAIFKKIYKNDLVILGKEKNGEAYMRDQIELRVKGNSSTVKNVNIKKQILKENNRDTILYNMITDYMKSTNSDFNTAADHILDKVDLTNDDLNVLKESFGQFNDLYEATVDYMANHPKTSFQTALIEVLKGLGLSEKDFDLIRTVLKENREEKVNLIFGRIKDYMQDHPGTKFQDAMVEVLKGVQHKDGDLIITEMAYGSDYEPKVLEYLKAHGKATAKELVSLFPNQTTSIPVLQRLLKSGQVVRDQSIRSAVWYLPSNAPQGIDTTIKPKESKFKTFSQKNVEEVYNLLRTDVPRAYRDEFNIEDISLGRNKDVIYAYLPTEYRGPRTDHGGEDGEGWMSPSEIERNKRPYVKLLQPKIKQIESGLKLKGFKYVDSYVDYGEKGHISLQITIKANK